MKLNIVPSLELSDMQLETVYGGGGAPAAIVPAGLGGGALGVGTTSSQACDQHIHSFSVLCDISIFSVNAIVAPIVNIATQTTQVCAFDR
jgi:hypothetical protein